MKFNRPLSLLVVVNGADSVACANGALLSVPVKAASEATIESVKIFLGWYIVLGATETLNKLCKVSLSE